MTFSSTDLWDKLLPNSQVHVSSCVHVQVMFDQPVQESPHNSTNTEDNDYDLDIYDPRNGQTDPKSTYFRPTTFHFLDIVCDLPVYIFQRS